MNYVKILVVLVFISRTTFLQTAQESSDFAKATTDMKIEDLMQESIDQSLIKYAHLDDNFEFLRSQGLIDLSFQDFLLAKLAQDYIDSQDHDIVFEEIIEQAHTLVSDSFKDGFFSVMNCISDSHENLNKIQDPLFVYVMQHKDGFMKPMMREWVYEWEKTFDKDGFPLLNWCLNHVEIAKILVDLKVDINMQDKGGWAPLHYAAYKNCVEKVEMYLNAGADINIQNDMKLTPLHIAAWQNHINVVRMLIDKGADLNCEDFQGNTPLYKTEYRGIINMLIAAGARLNSQDLVENSTMRFNYRQCVYYIIKDRKDIENNKNFAAALNNDAAPIVLAPKIRKLLPKNGCRCVIS